jgi:hypothetical protein
MSGFWSDSSRVESHLFVAVPGIFALIQVDVPRLSIIDPRPCDNLQLNRYQSTALMCNGSRVLMIFDSNSTVFPAPARSYTVEKGRKIGADMFANERVVARYAC